MLWRRNLANDSSHRSIGGLRNGRRSADTARPAQPPTVRASRSLESAPPSRPTAATRSAKPKIAADTSAGLVLPKMARMARATIGKANLAKVFHTPVSTAAMAIEPVAWPKEDKTA